MNDWNSEMSKAEVVGIRGIDSALKYFEKSGKNPATLGLNEFSVSDINRAWGKKFIYKTTETLRGENSILRGINRKASGRQNPKIKNKRFCSSKNALQSFLTQKRCSSLVKVDKKKDLDTIMVGLGGL